MRRMEWLFDAIQFQKIGLLYYANLFVVVYIASFPVLPPTCIYKKKEQGSAQRVATTTILPF